MARRLVPTLVLLLLLAACPGDAPEETEIRESDPGVFAGALTVRAAGPFLGGEEPVLDVRAGSRGTLALSLFRARQPDSAAASLFGSGGNAEQLDENTDFARVRTWNHAVSAGKSTLSLGPLEPGLYVLEAGASGKSLHVPVVVSNLSVVVKRGAGEALVWVVRAGNGRPVPDAAVTLHAEDGPRRLELDSDGVARVDVEDSERLRLFARDGDDIAIADATWLPSAPRDRLVYVTTDRPLYRPGETVGVKGIARRVVGERMKPF